MGFWKLVLILLPCLFFWWHTKDIIQGILLFLFLIIVNFIANLIKSEIL
jgi:hypothetical protein